MYIRGFARTLIPISGKGRADRKNQAVNLRKKEGPTVQRKKTFLVVCLSILMVVVRGQATDYAPVEKIVPDHLILTKMSPFTGSPTRTAQAPNRPYTALDRPHASPDPLLPFHMTEAYQPGEEAAYMGGGAYYTNTLGFFCKRELDVQKAIRLPVFFRLGSLEYCNKLEGK
jgi:hypothetical protein